MGGRPQTTIGLLQASNLIAVVRDILGMVSVFLNLLRLDLWHTTWSILETVPRVPEKDLLGGDSTTSGQVG